MKTKVNLKAKRISETGKRIGTTLLALAMITGVCTPAITSFTQAQPVTKTKKKAKAKKKTKAKKTKSKKKKSYKAKAGTISLSPITLTKGKSKTVSVKTKSKVKWTSSNAKIASVKSISKSKVKVTAKKKGSTKVSGKVGKAKWCFTVKVKGTKPIVKTTGKDTKNKANKTNTSKKKTNTSQKKANVKISGIENNETIEFDTPGEDEENFIYVDSSFGKNVKFKSSNTSVLGVKALNDDFLVSTASCQLIPYKEGNAVITISAPGYSKDYSVHVKASEAYKKVEGFISKVNSSGLDDAHKAFVTAKWLEKHASYGDSDTSSYIIDGKGVCSDYALTYEWLLKLENIKSRRIDTGSIGDHIWNQICVNGKWYNVDVSNNDEEPFNPEGAECFMKSDNCSNDFFSDRSHAVKYRSGNGEYPVTATATDYDNYDWSSFAQSEQFKSLIS